MLEKDPVEALWPNGRSDSERLKAMADDLFLGLGLKISDHAGICAIAPTGERYETCTAIGIRTEGERQSPKSLPETEQECVDGYLAQLRDIAQGKTGTVYWRVYPEIGRQYGRFNIYSRFLISDKPDIGAGAEAA